MTDPPTDPRPAPPEPAMQILSRHGIDCPKVLHSGEGYLHSHDYDGPYYVDGITYCGRCHGWLGSDIVMAESTTPNPKPMRDCKHGQLARSCELCELETEIERLRAGVRQLASECTGCDGTGVTIVNGMSVDCEDCADIRALLSETAPPHWNWSIR